MAKPIHGLSRELIIHPGETLREALEDRGLTQKTLAARVGMTEQHVSRVITGKTNISSSFAKKLEYVLDIPVSFWLNLQKNYDLELAEYEDQHGISEDECVSFGKMEAVLTELLTLANQEIETERTFGVIQARKLLGVANLNLIPALVPPAIYRVSKTADVDPYVTFAWHKLCDCLLQAVPEPRPGSYDAERLVESISSIKTLMFEEDINETLNTLGNLFGEMGIRFAVVRHFPGAPIHGMARLNESGFLDLCLTIRGSRIDMFWFSLFHEVAHVINGDFNAPIDAVCEERADRLAASLLIDTGAYLEFVNGGSFSLRDIVAFAKAAEIPEYMVIGRLQNDGHVPWDWYGRQIPRLKWNSYSQDEDGANE